MGLVSSFYRVGGKPINKSAAWSMSDRSRPHKKRRKTKKKVLPGKATSKKRKISQNQRRLSEIVQANARCLAGIESSAADVRTYYAQYFREDFKGALKDLPIDKPFGAVKIKPICVSRDRRALKHRDYYVQIRVAEGSWRSLSEVLREYYAPEFLKYCGAISLLKGKICAKSLAELFSVPISPIYTPGFDPDRELCASDVDAAANSSNLNKEGLICQKK